MGSGTDANTPRLSVVIPSYRAEHTIEACLEGLSRQSFTDFEAILVDSSPDRRTIDVVRRRFPHVVVDAADRRLRPHAARNRGAKRARGEMIVFTDADCSARRDWLERLVSAQEQGLEIVGGGIEPAGGTWFERGVHWCKFGPWVAGGPPGLRPVLPTANVCWSASAWERVGPFRLEGWSGDAELSWRARGAGYRLNFLPEAIVKHRHLTNLSAFSSERLERGRAFASLRARVGGWSRGRVLAHVLATPLVPFVLLARRIRRARETGRLLEGLATAPVQFLGYSAWAVGQFSAHWGILFRDEEWSYQSASAGNAHGPPSRA